MSCIISGHDLTFCGTRVEGSYKTFMPSYYVCIKITLHIKCVHGTPSDVGDKILILRISNSNKIII